MGKVSAAHLINDRWLRVLEPDIYRLYVGRGSVWAKKEIRIGGQARSYLASPPYFYPYSLPFDIIKRLAERLNEGRLMFNHEYWFNKFRETPGLNDTEGQIVIKDRAGTWAVLGVHRLTEAERPPHPMILFDVRCKTDNRDGMRPVYYAWTGMQPHERPAPAFVDKPPYEVGNIALMPGQAISMWMDDGDRASGFRQPDSYFVVFQEVEEGTTPPDPDPDPPDLEAKGTMEFRIDAVYFNSLPVDEQGKVRLIVPIYP